MKPSYVVTVQLLMKLLVNFFKLIFLVWILTLSGFKNLLLTLHTKKGMINSLPRDIYHSPFFRSVEK